MAEIYTAKSGENEKVVIRGPINLMIKIVYDPELPEAWDDSCRLWTTEDDGSTYNSTVKITDESLVRKDGNNLKILFKNVLPQKYYSCYLDLGENASGKVEGGYLLFYSLLITEDMQIDKSEWENE